MKNLIFIKFISFNKIKTQNISMLSYDAPQLHPDKSPKLWSGFRPPSILSRCRSGRSGSEYKKFRKTKSRNSELQANSSQAPEIEIRLKSLKKISGGWELWKMYGRKGIKKYFKNSHSRKSQEWPIIMSLTFRKRRIALKYRGRWRHLNLKKHKTYKLAHGKRK